MAGFPSQTFDLPVDDTLPENLTVEHEKSMAFRDGNANEYSFIQTLIKLMSSLSNSKKNYKNNWVGKKNINMNLSTPKA